MKSRPSSKVTFTVTVQLNEDEARALDAMGCYGADSFLEVFYKHMGRHYLSPHEAGVRSMFEHVRGEIGTELAKIDKARKAIEEATSSK